MTLPIDAALTALSSGARAKNADPLVQSRLGDVQVFLAQDLAAVEDVIAEALSCGPEPALQAAKHLVARGGKRVRPLALLLSARCFSGRVSGSEAGSRDLTAAVTAERESVLREMAAVVELVHSATLLHDDVVDEGMERRGVVTSRRIHGNGISVLAGDLLLVGALARTQRVAPALVGDLIQTLKRLVDGEIVQLRGRTTVDVSEATYHRILMDKTASLFAFSTRAGGSIAGAGPSEQEALSRFGEALGVAFQLVDDVIDYAGEQTGKALFADLGEGKLTLPLVLAIQRDPSLEILVGRIHAGDLSVCSEVSQRVLASGSCEEVRTRARGYTERALMALRELPQSPATRFLEVVAREMTQRVS